MKMTLKASLSSSTKEIDIYYGDPLLYIRPKEGSYRFPELYTTDGCEIVISELFLDKEYCLVKIGKRENGYQYGESLYR